MTARNLFSSLLSPVHRRAKEAYPAVVTRVLISGTLLDRELTTGLSIDIPWRRRLWLYRRGFTSRSSALFDVTADNYHQYVSDLQHERADDIAGHWDAVLNNKLVFFLTFGSFSEHLPELYGVVHDGTITRNSSHMTTPLWEENRSVSPGTVVTGEETTASTWLDAALDETDALVLKPIYGSGGQGVLVCRKREEERDYLVNGELKTPREFAALVDDLDEYLVWAHVQQADYAVDLFPRSANTLRVMTMWDDETDEPFVAGAVHRIGTSRSAPVDNWSRGGLSAEVGDDCELSRGAQWLPAEGAVRWYRDHPDTGHRIEGTRVPGWHVVRTRLAEIAAEFPYVPRIGWDVVLTDDGGFVVLEANAHAATRTLQVHRPLLTDPRVRRFYERHGCL